MLDLVEKSCTRGLKGLVQEVEREAGEEEEADRAVGEVDHAIGRRKLFSDQSVTFCATCELLLKHIFLAKIPSYPKFGLHNPEDRDN